MRIFWADTLEGPKIPMIMLRPGYDFQDFADMAAGSGSYLRNWVEPDNLQFLFDATDDELHYMMDRYAFGMIVLQNGRRLTLPPNTYGGPVEISIAPNAVLTAPPNFPTPGSYGSWTLENETSEYEGYNEGVLFNYENYLYKYARMSGQFGIMREPGAWGVGHIPVMARDDDGNVAFLTFRTSTSSTTPVEFHDKVMAADEWVSPMSWTGSISSGYLRSLNGDIVEAGDEPDPEPEPERSGIVDIMNRYSPRVGTSALGAYPLTKEQVNEFIGDMWTTSFAEKILYDINGKPMDSIVSLRWYYGLKNSIPRTELKSFLCIGNVVFDGSFGTNTKISTYPASKEFTMYDFGEIIVPRHFNNFLDLAPFTQLELFLPYYGFARLNPVDFMGKRMKVIYNINITTGVTMIHIYSREQSSNTWRVVNTLKCMIGVDIPLDINARESITSRVTTSMLGAAVTGLGMAASVAMPAVSVPISAGLANTAMYRSIETDANGVASSVVQSSMGTMINGIQAPQFESGNYTRSSGMDDESGSLGSLETFLVITRPEPVAPNDYNLKVGSPDYRSSSVSNLSGYFKVGAISNAGNTSIPGDAMQEVQQLLKAGVYYE